MKIRRPQPIHWLEYYSQNISHISSLLNRSTITVKTWPPPFTKARCKFLLRYMVWQLIITYSCLNIYRKSTISCNCSFVIKRVPRGAFITCCTIHEGELFEKDPWKLLATINNNRIAIGFIAKCPSLASTQNRNFTVISWFSEHTCLFKSCENSAERLLVLTETVWILSFIL